MKADTPREYRLVELRATNVKALKAVAVKIDGTMLKISGRNGQGKSSLLDAVAMAIGGPKAFPDKPIRKGQDKAEIFLDFGGLKLTRRIWEKEGGGIGQDLLFEYADGKRPKEKQTVLDALRGSPIADDPIAFSRLDPKKRYELLKQLVPDFDFAEHKAEHDALFEDRTIVGRDLARAKAAAEAIKVPEDAPLKLVDMSSLADDLQAAIKFNAEIDQRAQRREGFADELEAMRDRADSLRAELKQLEGEILAREKQLDEAEELPEKIDVDKIRFRMGTIEDANADARKRVEKTQREAEAAALTAKYDALTQRLKAMDEAKTAAIEGAKLPVPELTFGDDDILLDGLPFDQASTARKIRVSTALLMALKPDLRVLLVREGSLLDDDARAALEADATANNFVVLMECVGAGDGSGIVIENGEIV